MDKPVFRRCDKLWVSVNLVHRIAPPLPVVAAMRVAFRPRAAGVWVRVRSKELVELLYRARYDFVYTLFSVVAVAVEDSKRPFS